MNRSRNGAWITTALFAIAAGTALASVLLLRRSFFGFHPAAGGLAAVADAMLRREAPGHIRGGAFLTTYYFPPFSLIVAAIRLLGLDWLTSLRGASLISGGATLLAAGFAARALGAKGAGPWLAAALVAATYPFKGTLIDARADLLAAAFSIAALAAWSRDEDARGFGAPAFAAASLLVKATSLTLPIALVIWSLTRRRGGPIARFLLRFVIFVAAGLLLTLPVHGPAWYADTLSALFTHVAGRSSLVRGPAELLRYLGTFGELAIFAAIGGAWLMSRGASVRPVQAFALVSLVLTMLVMMNFASAQNHLVELSATLALCAALWAAPRLSRRALLPALAIAIAVLGASWRDLGSVLRHAGEPENLRAGVLDAVRGAPGDVLTEDPMLALVAGRRAAVSDLDALRALAMAHDPRATAAIEALDQRRYTLIVTNADVAVLRRLAAIVHFADPILEPIHSGYDDAGRADGFWLYRRRSDPLDRPERQP